MYTHAENAERTPCAQRPFSQCTLSATIDFLLRFFVCLKVFVYLLAVHNPCIRIIIVQVNADKVIRREKKQQQLNSRSMKNSTLFQQQQEQNTFSPIVSFYSFILFLLFFILASFGTKCLEYLQLICALSSWDAKFVFQNSISCQNGLIQFIALQFSHPKYCIEVKNFSGRARWSI